MIDTEFFDLLCRCHAKFVGVPLVDSGATARWLYEDAPFGTDLSVHGPERLAEVAAQLNGRRACPSSERREGNLEGL